MRIACQSPVDGDDRLPLPGIDNPAVGLIGINDLAPGRGDQSPLRQIINERLGDVVADSTITKSQNPNRTREQSKYTHHRQPAKNGEDKWFRLVTVHHGKRDGRDCKSDGKKNKETDTTLVARSVLGRFCVR